MTIGKGEATLDLVFPISKREQIQELANVEVVLLTGSLPYAIKLQRTCLRWCLNYSWQLLKPNTYVNIEPENMDIVVIDCDIGYDEALNLTHQLYEKKQELPALTVGSTVSQTPNLEWPPNVEGFLLKSLGTQKVVEYMISIGNGLTRN